MRPPRRKSSALKLVDNRPDSILMKVGSLDESRPDDGKLPKRRKDYIIRGTLELDGIQLKDRNF